MLKLKILAFSVFLFSGLITPTLSVAFTAAPGSSSGIELFSVGYGLDTIVLTERNGLTTPSMLLRIDPTDGSIIEIGDTGFINCNALDFNNDGSLYAKCQRPEPPNTPVLIMLNPETGEGTEIGETGVTENISDIAIDSEGSIFSYEEPGGDHNLHQVDASTGSANFIGNPGLEGQGNAIIAWDSEEDTLKLFSWVDGVNNAYKLDMGTAQPTFVTNLDMIDLTGIAAPDGPCIMVAAASTRSLNFLPPIIGATQLDRAQAERAGITIIDGFRFEAVGLNEIISGIGMASGVDNRIVLGPRYGLSVVDLDQGISILFKAIEPGYMLDGIAIRPLPPRPIPTMSEWGMITASVFLFAAALYFIVRRRTFIKSA